MGMLSSQSDVASPASPVLLIRQPEELETVSNTPTLFVRPRGWCQQRLPASFESQLLEMAMPFTDPLMLVPACLGA